jgi:hypothetical protein
VPCVPSLDREWDLSKLARLSQAVKTKIAVKREIRVF